jgi:hypothetical protein
MKPDSEELAVTDGLRAHLLGLLAGAGLIIGLTLLIVLLVKPH